MIRQCDKCMLWYEDVYRDTGCPHDAFPANDGNNNFKVNTAAYLSATKPPDSLILQAHGDT